MYEPFGGAALGIDVNVISYEGSFWGYKKTIDKSWKRDVVKVVVREPDSVTRATERRTEGALHPKRLARELSTRDDKH
jgi:hypothetical protein